jgi:hypothetical protein
MTGTRVQTVKEKTRCDGCARTGQQIAEYRFNCRFLEDFTCGCPHDGRRRRGCEGIHRKKHATVPHWFDLCPECGARDYLELNGFLVGLHANVQPRTKAHRKTAVSNREYGNEQARERRQKAPLADG